MGAKVTKSRKKDLRPEEELEFYPNLGKDIPLFSFLEDHKISKSDFYFEVFIGESSVGGRMWKVKKKAVKEDEDYGKDILMIEIPKIM